MGKNHSSIVVLWILPKFWWMLPMGVRDNHTKYEPSGLRQAASGSPKRWVPKWVNKVRQVQKKNRIFSKMILDHMACQNKCFWGVVGSWWPPFDPPKLPKCLENGLFFGTKKWLQSGSKMCFSKNEPRPFGVHKQVKCAPFEPIASHFGPSKVTKCLENGLFCDEKWVKNGSKMCFPKNDPRPFGVHK